jgi:hypothetical protein
MPMNDDHGVSPDPLSESNCLPQELISWLFRRQTACRAMLQSSRYAGSSLPREELHPDTYAEAGVRLAPTHGGGN